MQPTSLAFKRATRTARWPTRRCRRRSARSRPAGSPARRRAPPTGCPSSRRCATTARRHQGPHAGPSRPLPRGVRGQGDRAGRHGALGARRRRGARDRARALPRRRCPLGDQEQEHDHRGDRPQRVRSRRSGIDAGRDRPRRVHRADRRRAAEPHRRPGGPHDQGRDRRPVRAAPRRRRGSRTPSELRRRGAPASCASATSRPTSASPAPTSWSPRPARRSPSPTRATPS